MALFRVDERLDALVEEEASSECQIRLEQNCIGMAINERLATYSVLEALIENNVDAVLDCLEGLLQAHDITYTENKIIHLRGDEKKKYIACIHVDFLENPAEEIRQKYSLLVRLQELSLLTLTPVSNG